MMDFFSPKRNLKNLMMVMGLLLTVGYGQFASAQSVDVVFDGTEGSVLTQLSTQPDEATNQTLFGRDKTFYAGASHAVTPFIFTSQRANLLSGDTLTYRASFYNRDRTGSYNEAYLWIGPDHGGTNIMTIFPAVEQRQGFSIGYATSLGTLAVDNGDIGDTPVLSVLNSDTSFVNSWVDMEVTFAVVSGNFVVTDLSRNGTTIVSNYVVGPAGDYPWLDNAFFGIMVDDVIGSVSLSGPALIPNGPPAAIPATSWLAQLMALMLLGLCAVGFFWRRMNSGMGQAANRLIR